MTEPLTATSTTGHIRPWALDADVPSLRVRAAPCGRACQVKQSAPSRMGDMIYGPVVLRDPAQTSPTASLAHRCTMGQHYL
jgi:hypothetical protein